MLNAKSFLAIDFGAANLKVAEFQLTEDGGLLLKQYGLKSFGKEGTQDSTRDAATQQALQELLAERSYLSKNVNISAPGFHTFSKFVKLPPVDTSKVTQIIQYEAQQNVPFPLEEVVWDYQILGAAPNGELEVLLVAIKSEVVERLFRVAEDAGLRPQLVDVSPAALCNAFRYNYSDLEGCSMLLDIGARTSNLLFFEGENVYARGITFGASTITQELAKEAQLTYAQAEQVKIEEGFVSLGGAYEDPDNPLQAAVSKIARQVLTRLHIQVNQTIQFYRGQQGGSAPQRLFLSGGAAIMPYTAQFFSEKLNLAPEAVEYFNSLRYVQLDPEINREELAKVAHNFGEVVGLGLRNLAHCPVELNLMPKSSLTRQQLGQKKPYFIASAACLVSAIFAGGWFYEKVAGQKSEALEKLVADVAPLQRNDVQLRQAMIRLKTAGAGAAQYTTSLEDKYYWAVVLSQLRDALLAVEGKQEQVMKAKIGVWIEEFRPVLKAGLMTGAVESPGGPAASRNPNVGRAPAPRPPGVPPPGGRANRRSYPPSRPPGQSDASEGDETLSTVILRCRGVNVNRQDLPAANTDIAAAVEREIQSRGDYFDPAGTVLSGDIKLDPSELTFTFQVTLTLKRPLQF